MWGLPRVVQWLRESVTIQGTQGLISVPEDPTNHGATQPVCQSH